MAEMAEKAEMAEMQIVPRALQITDLNDDCLTEIFKYLQLEDLNSLSVTNTRFFNPIKSAVPYIETTLNNLRSNFKYNKDFFVNFGDQVRNLHFQYFQPYPFATIFFEKILNDFFRGNRVKHCTFTRCALSKGFVLRNAEFFRSLETLNLVETMTMRAPDSERTDYVNMITKVNEMGWQLSKSPTVAGHDIVNELVALFELPFRAIPPLTLVNKFKFYHGKGNHLAFKSLPNVVSLGLELHSNNMLKQLPASNLSNLQKLSLNFTKNLSQADRDNIFYSLSARYFPQLKSLSIFIDRIHSDDKRKLLETVCQLQNLTELSLLNFLPINGGLGKSILNIALNLKELQVFEYEYEKNESTLCHFVRLAPTLVTLSLIEHRPPADSYDSFYDKLSSIRERQNSQKVLYVKILGCQRSCFKQRTKWVKLTTTAEGRLTYLHKRAFEYRNKWTKKMISRQQRLV